MASTTSPSAPIARGDPIGDAETICWAFVDGSPLNNRELAFYEGNDSNLSISFPAETDGWHAALPGIDYASGRAVVDVATRALPVAVHTVSWGDVKAIYG